MPALWAIIGAVIFALGIAGYVLIALNILERVRSLWRRYIKKQHDPLPATKEDIAELKAAVGRLAEYLDGLPQATPKVRDPFEKGRRLQEAEQHEAAIRQFEKALAAAKDESQRCALHNLIGNRLRELGRPAEAEGHYRQAVDAAQKAQDKKGEAFSLGNLGLTYEDLRQQHRAQDHFAQSLAAFEETGERDIQAVILTHLSARSLERGQRQRAKALAERAVALHPLQPGYQDTAFLSLAVLGRVCELLDDPNEASRLYAEAERVASTSEVSASSDPEVAAVLRAVRQALQRLAAASPPKPKRKRTRKKPPPKP